MQRYLSMLLLFMAVTFHAAAQGPVMTLETDNHNFGQINEGEKAEYEFEFTNTGDAPLVISDISRTCGCTTPSYSKDPVMPGEKGKIKVVFDSEGRPGRFHKSITVTTNEKGNSRNQIYLRGQVMTKGG
ncbi:MAG: DUF1573 domain-containing protein [Bacteroidia bacterium]